MSVDWSKAPEGATHFDTGMHNRVAGWMKFKNEIWYWWPSEDAPIDKKWYSSLNQHRVKTDGFIERPITWIGEGLPPVGTVCEISLKSSIDKHAVDIERYKSHAGKKVEIVAHHDIGGGCRAAVYAYSNDFAFEYHSLIEGHFRPIRTAEQIAEDERLHSIRNACTSIMKVIEPYNLNLECSAAMRATVEAMIDAGYSKSP